MLKKDVIYYNQIGPCYRNLASHVAGLFQFKIYLFVLSLSNNVNYKTIYYSYNNQKKADIPTITITSLIIPTLIH